MCVCKKKFTIYLIIVKKKKMTNEKQVFEMKREEEKSNKKKYRKISTSTFFFHNTWIAHHSLHFHLFWFFLIYLPCASLLFAWSIPAFQLLSIPCTFSNTTLFHCCSSNIFWTSSVLLWMSSAHSLLGGPVTYSRPPPRW